MLLTLAALALGALARPLIPGFTVGHEVGAGRPDHA